MLVQNHQLYTFPPEWHRQDGIQLTWPHEETDWKPYLSSIKFTFKQLAAAIAQREKLLVVTPHPEETLKELETCIDHRHWGNVKCFECPTNDTWARDHGALTLLPAQRENETRPKMLNYRFNGWGEKFDWQLDNAINDRLDKAGAFKGEMASRDDFVLEGGSVETDGMGTILTTRCCLLAPHRNQPMTQQQIEQQLKIDFSAQRVLWLEHGRLTGDDTDGHIDTLARFAPNDTIIFQGCEDENDEHFAELKAMEEELQGMTTLSGKPYRLVKLPLPDPIFDGTDRLPATYANFVILNGAVLVPTYHQKDKDNRALKLIAGVFPDREVIGIDARTVIRQHGSLHCLTMQFPEGTFNF